jgi:hypothetical protein
VRGAQEHPRRWPLWLIAAPAAVAVWSGWVGLGELCGFGVIHPLPGIIPGFQLNTAITLPVGVEAYAAFALGAWVGPLPVSERARSFARRSAIGALVLGMTGQVAYHLLAAAHAQRAPVPVVVLVSCMPVVVFGFGAALAHLLRLPAEATTAEPSAEAALEPEPEPVVTTAEQVTPPAITGAGPKATRKVTGRGPAKAEQAARAAVLAGQLVSARSLARNHHIGRDRAGDILASVRAELAEQNGHVPVG